MLKKILINIAIVLAVTAAAVLPVNYLYEQTNTFANINYQFKFDIGDKMYDAMALGASDAREGFDFTQAGVNGVNFSTAGQTLYHDYQLLKKYGKNLNPGATIILSLNYQAFIISRQSEDFLIQDTKYYNILDRNQLYDYKLYDDIMFSLLPVLNGSDNLKAIIQDEELGGPFEYIYNINVFNEQEQLERLDYLMDIGYGFEGLRVYDECVDDLIGIIEYCRDNGLRLVLVKMPYHKMYEDAVRAYENIDVGEVFFDVMDRISKEYSLEYINYSGLEPFYSDRDMFYGAGSHLNNKGRRAMTGIVFKDLGLVTD